jgi:hypothetical protein
MPLVEFKRYNVEDGSEGSSITINPEYVSFVFPSLSNDRSTIIRGPDGRGFVVVGSYEEVKRKLEFPPLQAVPVN